MPSADKKKYEIKFPQEFPFTAEFHKYKDEELLKTIPMAHQLDREESMELIEELGKRWKESNDRLHNKRTT